jgi:uncharacterized protein YbcI
VVEHWKVFGHIGFFYSGGATIEGKSMENRQSTMAQQVAKAASAFQLHHTSHVPQAVTVVLSGDTLVITLYEALSPVEKALAKSPAGAAKVREFHRQLFATCATTLRQ